ncbi:Spt20 domain containing protein [Euroglyphus maynei]|uniref:Spt20 domain containing protein n=1 Tax=Euroglyphus maynei TaxID=6958 RepID=A0A1Y3BAL0_EURMA|nr:Spt20 domain containing protein [Euroglyphus maynei]
MHHIPANEACETEEEVDEENYNFNNADVDSKSYLVNLYKNLKNCNYFLNSLIVNEQLDYVVISLFKNHQFSFGIKLFDSDTVFERVHFTCEDNHIVDYIDNEELPPKLIDVIEMFDFKNIYYNGCIISEIRDYRQSSTDFFNSYFILLKPTSLSLYNDVKKIIGLTNKSYAWTNTARLKLESKLIYLTSPKLCLDPNPCIGILSKKLSRKKLIFGNKLFLRLPRKRLKSIIDRDQSKEFRLLNFLKIKKPTTSFVNKMKPNPLAIESQMKIMQTQYKDVQKLAKQLTEPKDSQSNELVKTEEYRMEFLDATGTIITLTIFRRPYDDVYFGNIVNMKNGDTKSAPNFYLGTKEMKRRYIEQFIETFSENGKKLIKITQRIGNEEPKVKHTQAVEMYLLRQQQQQNSAKLKAEQQINSMKNESNVVQHQQAPKQTIILNSLINNHQLHTTNAPNYNTGTIITTTTAPSSSVNNTSTVTKLTPNQIVIKHSNLKLLQAANSNVINKGSMRFFSK